MRAGGALRASMQVHAIDDPSLRSCPCVTVRRDDGVGLWHVAGFLQSIMTPADTAPMDPGTLPVLADHHRTLDERLKQLLTRTRAGDARELRADWGDFDRELLRHMELEETEMLRGFASHNPDEARALLAEHCAIRNVLLDIGINLDLHSLRLETIEELARRLKAHAQREDGAFYTWASTHVPASGWQAIKQGLKEVIARGGRSLSLNDRIM